MLNIEEMNLLYSFDVTSRNDALNDIQSFLTVVEDAELRESLNVLTGKLENMTDEEFDKIDFSTLKEDAAYDE